MMSGSDAGTNDMNVLRSRYDQKQLGLHLTTSVVAREESTEHADLALANQTLAQMGFQTNTRDWVGVVRTYLCPAHSSSLKHRTLENWVS